MFAMGFAEILMFMLLGSGGLSSDLVSMIDANAYFQSRGIPVTVDKMLELATKDPTDAKTQLAQLLALRTLTEDAAEVKKAKNFKEILAQVEAIANGDKARDPHGFAADYAQRTATALGSKLAPVARPVPENSLRQDALAWFPENVTLVAGVEFRSGEVSVSDAAKLLREMLFKFMPPNTREELFAAAEKLGNVRLDRYSFAYAHDDQNQGKSRIYMRFTGKGDQKRLLELFQQLMPGVTVQEQKNFRGQKVTLLHSPNNPPAFAFVGDTDLVIAGVERNDKAGHLQVVEQVLAVRSGGQKSVLTGALAESLKKISSQANGMLVGTLPEQMRADLTRGEGFRSFPKSVLGEMSRKRDVVEIRWQGTLDSEQDATSFTEDVARLKKQALDGLKNLPPGVPLPAKAVEQITKTLEGIKAEAKGATVQGSVTVPNSLIMEAPLMMFMGVQAAPVPPPVQPPPPAPGNKE